MEAPEALCSGIHQIDDWSTIELSSWTGSAHDQGTAEMLKDRINGRWGAKVGIRDPGGRELFDVRLLPEITTSYDEYKPFY